ncbi:MAG: DUF763 domain-containing protein [Candidatus Aenigmarchaeota archaeon]|nr:DUF763 domain-containing protein [Candidatus Aenigmarchaeota archaeon]MDW8149689.1 DUF763 domain-containing protein [Candidatus Aenigmarchaeota archaeon]
MKVGIAELPLHYGKCPKWLFEKMVKLSKEISILIIEEYGKEEYLRRITNPFFFQCFACVVGFDWHSSGTSTTLTSALKKAFEEVEVGVKVLGGKGTFALKVPEELLVVGEKYNFSDKKIEELKYASKMVAKVDNCAIQAGYKLYHHSFFVLENGKWAVIQQGMNEEKRLARRYHWIDEKVKSFVEEPHLAIIGYKEKNVLNMVAKESEEARKACVDIVNEKNIKYLKMPFSHSFYKKFLELSEFKPKNYEEILAFRGVGPKTVRALALIAKLVYGKDASWVDPVTYTFAHGGKDGIPYPIDRKTYEESIKTLKEIIEACEIEKKEKVEALKRLATIDLL